MYRKDSQDLALEISTLNYFSRTEIGHQAVHLELPVQ